jgi:hypothetical protein
MRNYVYPIIVFVFLAAPGCSGHNGVTASAGVEKNISEESETAPVLSAVESSSGSEEQAKPAEFKPFAVYKDKGYPNRFTPSGYMPTGECLYMNDAWTEKCTQGKSCIKVIYDIDCSKKGRNWAGIYWLNPADNWGDRKGGYNLNGAQKISFFARGEKGGERIEEFKIGGVGRSMEYPDSDSAFIGPVILTNEWKEYTIDLRGKDLSSISGGFAWVTNTDVNPEACVFYLDDIQYK